MVIVMEETATEDQVSRVIEKVIGLGFDVYRITGMRLTLLGAVGERNFDLREIEVLDGVHQVLRVSTPYRLASRARNPEGSRVSIKDLVIGGADTIVFATFSRIEAVNQIEEVQEASLPSGAARLIVAGASATTHLLKDLKKVADRADLFVAVEVTNSGEAAHASRFADMIQIPGHATHNRALLSEAAASGKPLILERSTSATIEESLIAAEHILEDGNAQVVICERGIRTSEPFSNSAFDITSIPILKRLTHLPVIANPGLATGRGDLVAPVAMASVAAGVDALLIEVTAGADSNARTAARAISVNEFNSLYARLRKVAAISRAADITD